MKHGRKDGDLMYRIGIFSKLGRVTIKTLHHYDEVGLLTPAHIDEENGYRYYATNQLFRLHEIIALRQMGFSIQEISAIVDGHNISGIFTQRKAELESEAQDLRRFYNAVPDDIRRVVKSALRQPQQHGRGQDI